MKTKLILILFLILCISVTAQEDTLARSKYRCSVDFVKNVKSLKGEIFALNDSSVIIKQKIKYRKHNTVNSDTLITVPVKDIHKFRLIKKGNPGKGILIGGGTGALLGATIGFAGGDDKRTGDLFGDIFSFTAGEKATIGAILGFVPGSIIGLAMGSSKFEIYIYGNIDTYISKREKLVKYSIRH